MLNSYYLLVNSEKNLPDHKSSPFYLLITPKIISNQRNTGFLNSIVTLTHHNIACLRKSLVNEEVPHEWRRWACKFECTPLKTFWFMQKLSIENLMKKNLKYF